MPDRIKRAPFYPGNSREHLTSRFRLRSFDYSTPGYYFLTLPVKDRRGIFGRVENGQMLYSEPGQMVHELILSPPDKFPHHNIDSWVIMPNHVHLLLYISIQNEMVTVSDFIKWMKGASTAAYRNGVRLRGWPDMGGKLWQAGFNDEIVRNDQHLENVRRYIVENPSRWDEDDLA